MKITRLIMALIPAAFLAAASMVQAQTPGVASWEGFYGGLNVGAARNATCNTWTANVVEDDTFTAFSSRNCPTDTAFVGGVQIGYNFQFDRVVLGIGLDYDFWNSKTRTSSFNYNGDEPPPDGTYGFSGKVSPNSFAILGPSLGYVIDNFLPYFRVGAVYAGGSHTSTAGYTGDDVTATAAGGKYYKSSGFGAGIGLDYLVADHWFVSAEYTYINLGKGSSTNPSCYSSSEGACEAFTDVVLNNSRNTFTANLLRIGLNYKFGGAPQQAPPPPPPTAAATPSAGTTAATAATAAAQAGTAVSECSGGRDRGSLRLPLRCDPRSSLRDQFIGLDGPGQGAARQGGRDVEAAESGGW